MLANPLILAAVLAVLGSSPVHAQKPADVSPPAKPAQANEPSGRSARAAPPEPVPVIVPLSILSIPDTAWRAAGLQGPRSLTGEPVPAAVFSAPLTLGAGVSLSERANPEKATRLNTEASDPGLDLSRTHGLPTLAVPGQAAATTRLTPQQFARTIDGEPVQLPPGLTVGIPFELPQATRTLSESSIFGDGGHPNPLAGTQAEMPAALTRHPDLAYLPAWNRGNALLPAPAWLNAEATRACCTLVSSVPDPAPYALMLAGLAMVGARAARRPGARHLLTTDNSDTILTS